MSKDSQTQVKQKYKILIVSMEKENVSKERKALVEHGYQITCVDSIESAMHTIDDEKIDLLVIDFSMHRKLDTNMVEQACKMNNSGVDILLLTAQNAIIPSIETMKQFNIYGYCEKYNDLGQLIMLVDSGIQIVYQKRQIQKINEELSDTKKLLEKNYLDSIETLRHTVDAKDTYTRGHSDRVAEYAVLIGKKMGLCEKDLKILHTGGLFHDIGKIGIPDSILCKNSRLSNEEYMRIKDHASIGAEILADAAIFRDIIPIVKYHHERFDGNGYPEGLAGEKIPLLARITSVADTFDAMYSKRVYRDRMRIEDIVEEIARNRGTQFDPNVADAFLDVVRNDFVDIERIQRSY